MFSRMHHRGRISGERIFVVTERCILGDQKKKGGEGRICYFVLRLYNAWCVDSSPRHPLMAALCRPKRSLATQGALRLGERWKEKKSQVFMFLLSFFKTQATWYPVRVRLWLEENDAHRSRRGKHRSFQLRLSPSERRSIFLSTF